MKKDLFFDHLRQRGLEDPGACLPLNMKYWFTIKVEEEPLTLTSLRYNSSKVAILSDRKSHIPLL